MAAVQFAPASRGNPAGCTRHVASPGSAATRVPALSCPFRRWCRDRANAPDGATRPSTEPPPSSTPGRVSGGSPRGGLRLRRASGEASEEHLEVRDLWLRMTLLVLFQPRTGFLSMCRVLSPKLEG